jgi:hypothetical protein
MQAIIWSFILKYWKELLSFTLIFTLLIVIGVYRHTNNKKEKEITELKHSISMLERINKELEEEKKQRELFYNESLSILKELQGRETTSETKYKETVVNNKEVIKEYVESKKEPEDLRKLYEWKNSLWENLK